MFLKHEILYTLLILLFDNKNKQYFNYVLKFAVNAQQFFPELTENPSLNKVKITTECSTALITLNIHFNEKMFPEGQFHDWIIVGNTMRNECKLKGNGELRYVVQIALPNDPCGIYQNTLRIASFPGLILSEDLNYEFKCIYGLPEVNEFHLTHRSSTARPEKITPPFNELSIVNDQFEKQMQKHDTDLTRFDNQLTQPLHLSTDTIQRKKANPSTEILQIPSPSISLNIPTNDVDERVGPERINDLNENDNFITMNNIEQKAAKNANKATEFNTGDHWHRNSISPAVIIGMIFLAGFLILGCVLLGIFYWVKQNRLTKNQLDLHNSRFNQLHSRHTSPVLENNSSSVSMSPASDECGIEHLQKWRMVPDSKNSTTFGILNRNLESLAKNQTTILLRKKQQQISSSSSVFSSGYITEGTISRGVLTINTGNDKYSSTANLNSDAEAENTTAACRSITEIYRSAEMKLKNMMPNEEILSRKTEFKIESTAIAKTFTDEKLEYLLISCVNKIRGFGTRKLTEQEMLRWRQLKLAVGCRSIEELHKLSEMPEYRLQFTKLKWIQIVQCMAENLLENNGNLNSQEYRLNEKRIC